MQESGVGLYYGESFNTFKDLGRSIRSRFVNPERQQRRRERRETKRTAKLDSLARDEDTQIRQDLPNTIMRIDSLVGLDTIEDNETK